MKNFGLIAALFLIVVSTCGMAHAAPEKFILDKDHTYVGFDVSYMLFARVSGRFDDFQGSFIIDRQHPENNRADIIIKTGSVDTGVKSRDENIRGPGLFNAERHPTMVFHSKSIKLDSDNRGLIVGELTLLGVTKPVTLDLVRIPGLNSKEGQEKSFAGGFKVTGKIKRSDFGMNAYIKPIGNTVTLYVCYDMIKCGDEDTNQEQIKPQYTN